MPSPIVVTPSLLSQGSSAATTTPAGLPVTATTATAAFASGVEAATVASGVGAGAEMVEDSV